MDSVNSKIPQSLGVESNLNENMRALKTNVNKDQREEVVRREFGRLWGVVFIIVFILLIGIAAVRFTISNTTRASVSGNLSLDNSYVFASPLSTCSDGISRVRITVFILDEGGFGMSGQSVDLAVTDSVGKAYFDISSTTANKYKIEAKVGNRVLPQNVSVGFSKENCL